MYKEIFVQNFKPLDFLVYGRVDGRTWLDVAPSNFNTILAFILDTGSNFTEFAVANIANL